MVRLTPTKKQKSRDRKPRQASIRLDHRFHPTSCNRRWHFSRLWLQAAANPIKEFIVVARCRDNKRVAGEGVTPIGRNLFP
jgi:hypothetical protein